MTTIPSQTFLKPSSKVINHSDTFFSFYCTNVLRNGQFQFSNSFGVILIKALTSKGSDKPVV